MNRGNFGDQYNFQFVSYIYYFLTAPTTKMFGIEDIKKENI